MTRQNTMRKFSMILVLYCVVLLPAWAGGESEAGGDSTPVTSPFQAWADSNGNERLEPQELEELTRAVWNLLREPHDVGNPLDELFDQSRDDHIDMHEVEQARAIVCRRRLPMLYEFMPDAAKRLDLNDNRRIDRNEMEILMDFLFFNPRFREPHRVNNPLDKRLDLNRDGRIDREEVESNTFEIFLMLSVMPMELPQNLAERGSVDQSPEERRGRPGQRRFRDQPAGQGRYPVNSIVDELFDLNDDGVVDEFELELAARFVTVGLEEDQPVDKLYILFDRNGNGEMDPEDLPLAIEQILSPHRRDDDFEIDRELDRNSNGFIEPEEIGIAAGYTPGGSVAPFLERLEVLMREVGEAPERPAAEGQETVAPSAPEKEAETVQKKLDTLQDKKVAVMGLTAQTKRIDGETSDGIVVFIENAFVNTGKVRVVDRQNIAKIVEEHQFQLSDITDETTAVQIGKLSGADIIVIGSISFVANKYYLNIKLISVETAEIIGSSISDVQSESDFLDMANTAVFSLF